MLSLRFLMGSQLQQLRWPRWRLPRLPRPQWQRRQRVSLLFVVLVTERPISKLGEKMIVVVDPVFVRVARVDAMEVVPQSTINHARILHNVHYLTTLFALATSALKSRRDISRQIDGTA